MVTFQAKVRATAYTGPTTVTGFSDSLFLIQLTTAVESEEVSAAPTFRLSANAPNPFNPVTVIPFQLPTRGRATLRVYSIHGALVRTLVDGVLAQGPHKANWDGRDDRGVALASGVYAYELIQGEKRLSRKMSLLK